MAASTLDDNGPCAASESSPSNSVEIDWYAEHDTVIVSPRNTPGNMKRFAIQKDRAIEVLQAAQKAEVFDKQFGLLLDRLAEWINQHQGKISEAILTAQDGSLSFVVVRTEAELDDEFQDALTALEFDIANDANLDVISLDTMALPPVTRRALSSFLDAKFSMRYVHGKRN